MERLDPVYLSDLVVKAQGGSSNACAELYGASVQQQYGYACRCLLDENAGKETTKDAAREALKEVYVQMIHNIRSLQSPALFTAWLSSLTFRACLEKMEDAAGEDTPVQAGGGTWTLRQILNLPLTESQVTLMRYYQKLKTQYIADLLNMSGSSVRRYLRSAQEHLKRLEF